MIYAVDKVLLNNPRNSFMQSGVVKDKFNA